MTAYEIAVDLWRQRNIQNDAALAEALNAHSISFAYHSGRIENEKVTYHDTREIFEHDGVTSYTGDLRTLFEIRNAKDAYEMLLNAFEERRPLDEALIHAFQFQLTKNTYDARRWKLGERPGEYKKHDYVTGREEVGAAPGDVAEEMCELLAELKEIPDEKALTAVAYYHVKFENIHPYADGNGRVGRLTMNYYLILHNHPPIIIHEEDRGDYFKAREAWNSEQALIPMLAFMKVQTAKTWQKQIDRKTGSVSGKS